MTTSSVVLQVSKYGEPSSQLGQLILRHFTPQQRALRAAKSFLLFLSLGTASVFIPILHFFLVPLFAFLAPVSAFFMFVQKEQIESASAQCPYCNKNTLLPRAKTTFPFRDSCQHCRQLIEICK